MSIFMSISHHKNITELYLPWVMVRVVIYLIRVDTRVDICPFPCPPSWILGWSLVILVSTGVVPHVSRKDSSDFLDSGVDTSEFRWLSHLCHILWGVTLLTWDCHTSVILYEGWPHSRHVRWWCDLIPVLGTILYIYWWSYTVVLITYINLIDKYHSYYKGLICMLEGL